MRKAGNVNGLLRTPQADKPCHLQLERCHAWPSLCFQSLFYSEIHCILAVLPQRNPEKIYMRLERDNPTHARESRKGDVDEQPRMKQESQFWLFCLILFKLFNNTIDF